MMAFEVEDMTCGHCVSAITKALKAVDKDAEVRFDLAMHRVQVEASADAAQLAQAIQDAGYTPVAVAAAAHGIAAAARVSCCGNCH